MHAPFCLPLLRQNESLPGRDTKVMQILCNTLGVIVYFSAPHYGFGHVEGYNEGEIFKSRIELWTSGMHRLLQGSICGQQDKGKNSFFML
jgi:hypothetical protein